MINREMDLEEYSTCERGLWYNIPNLLTRWVQIRFLDCIDRKWKREDRETFIDLEFIWTDMELRDKQEPNLPPGQEI